ncbi:MAG TPA: chemotaxis protein CheA, partial [bacterium]
RMVGELVVIGAGLKHFERRMKELGEPDILVSELDTLNDELGKVSNALQRRVLKTRMLPVDVLFSQYARVVRDLTKRDGKEIDLVIRGGETELDKKVIDAMGDPLTHVVRNAVDHGIETGKERARQHKPPRARLELTAEQAGNRIVITVKDDGRGIDLEKVRRKAVKMGLLHADGGEMIGENELLNVLFEPGFSTADEVTLVSGRGVGLDVVKNIVSSMNGHVQIRTKAGVGTTVVVTLPLTLAVSSVFVVESSGNRYGIPLGHVIESAKIPEDEIRGKACAPAVQLRDRIIPIVGLNDVLDGSSGQVVPDAHGMVPIVVASHMDREIGLTVDRILGKQEIVLKSLEENYKFVRGLSGVAILGDGSIVLVVDTLQMIAMHRERNQNPNETEIVIGSSKP